MSGRYGKVVKIRDKKKINEHLVHVLETVKINWVKNFSSVSTQRQKKKSAVKTPSSFDSKTNEEEKVIKHEYICLLNYFCTVLMS